MTSNAKPATGTETNQHIQDLAKVYGGQIVRRDNKFFDIDRLGTPLSRVDVEMVILNRIREEHPNLPHTNEILKGLFKLLIDTRHTDTERSFQVWSGATICEPGNSDRLIMRRGSVSANTWTQPEYRDLKVNSADYGVVGEFFDVFFQEDHDREQFLNWAAWCLQNEGQKPSWAPFLYSRGKGTGKSTTCRVLSELFGVSNTVTQNNVSRLLEGSHVALSTQLAQGRCPRARPASPQTVSEDPGHVHRPRQGSGGQRPLRNARGRGARRGTERPHSA